MDTKREQERKELFSSIWKIADSLRGAVDGWDFKNYVLGFMFYRFISENLTNYINADEHKSGNINFDYSKLTDAEASCIKDDMVQEKGFFILPSELFCNVVKNAYNDAKHEHLFVKVYGKYRKIISNLGLKSNLASYKDFEGKFIGEDYQQYGDLFLFLIMRSVTYIRNPQKITDGLFLARFAIMLQDLYKGTISEDEKEHLINIAKKFIDLVTK